MTSEDNEENAVISELGALKRSRSSSEATCIDSGKRAQRSPKSSGKGQSEG
jgi:hypothetical protein